MIPQKKKSPEEIAKLRESLGLPGASPSPAAAPEVPAVSAPPAQSAPQPPVHVSTAPPYEAHVPAPAPEIRTPVEPKPVRSLRKSERIPRSHPAPAHHSQSSSLPAQRHSENELNQIRRAQAFANRQAPPVTHLLAITANPFLVGLGYFCAFAAAFMPVADWRMWFAAPYVITASLAGFSLLIAFFIFLKKKRSVHNACFIAAIAFFTLIFSALYYFPQLRNAS